MVPWRRKLNRKLKRFIEDSYLKLAIAECFVARLDASIRDRVVAKFQGKPRISGTGLLNVIAEYTGSVWINLSGELTLKMMPALSIKAASSCRAVPNLHVIVIVIITYNNVARVQTPAPVAARSRPKRYHCDHHGPKNTHDSRDYLVMNGQ